MMADLPDTQYHYPQHIGTTDLHPDIAIWQNEPKEVTLVEPTSC